MGRLVSRIAATTDELYKTPTQAHANNDWLDHIFTFWSVRKTLHDRSCLFALSLPFTKLCTHFDNGYVLFLCFIMKLFEENMFSQSISISFVG